MLWEVGVVILGSLNMTLILTSKRNIRVPLPLSSTGGLKSGGVKKTMPPEFTLWTFPSDLATKPRAKPPNDAPKPMSPPEPPDSDSSIGVPFAAYFPHGGDHGTIFPGA